MQGETFLWWPIIACSASGRGLLTKVGRGVLFFFARHKGKSVGGLQDCRCGQCGGDERENPPRGQTVLTGGRA